MKKLIPNFGFLVFIILIYCGKGNQTSAQNISEVRDASNPEKSKPNTGISPAFKGQTRAKAVKTLTPISVEIISENLGRPWGITNLPDGRFLITEKSGFLLIISKDGKMISKVEGLPKVANRGQGGLLDIALDPEFQNNRMLYWTFSEPFSGGNHTAVAKGKLSDDEKRIENPSIIFRATPTYDGDKHFGSRLAFDREGFLFVSTGERSDLETRPLAQNQNSYLGKILKITKEGKPASGNPNFNGWKPEIYSTGHRNPQGIAIHPNNGELWEAEMGPRGGDEVNLIKPGANYGWPTITYGEEYSGMTIGEGIGKKEGLEQPIYYWDPSVSMSGIDFYTGSIPEWKDNLILGCLGGEKIIRLVIENHKVIGEEWFLEEQGERFRDVLSGKDGHLYAITDSGKLYKISKK